jgi:nitrite reductase/ring-hydroxylating ferredoxin subunit
VISETHIAVLRRAWYPVARAVDLHHPQKATVLGRRLVAFRTADGRPRVLPDRCLHRGGALHRGAVVDDAIECPYHRWRWRGTDGQCVFIPSYGPPASIPRTAVIGSFPAVQRYGLVWTCVSDTFTEPPDLPELEPLEMTYAAGEPVDVGVGIVAATENSLSMAHSRLIGRETRSAVAQQVSKFEYRFVMPGIATVLLFDHGVGGKRVVLQAICPTGPTGCRIFLVSGTAAGFTAFDPAATLAAEMQILHQNLSTGSSPTWTSRPRALGRHDGGERSPC